MAKVKKINDPDTPFMTNEEGNFMITWLLQIDHLIEFFDPKPKEKKDSQITVHEFYIVGEEWNQTCHTYSREEANMLWLYMKENGHSLSSKNEIDIWRHESLESRNLNKKLMSSMELILDLDSEGVPTNGVYYPSVSLDVIYNQASTEDLDGFAIRHPNHELSKMFLSGSLKVEASQEMLKKIHPLTTKN